MRSAVGGGGGGGMLVVQDVGRGRLFGHVRVHGCGGHGRQVVREAVPAEVAVPAEHFAARRTVVRFDVGVRQQVRLEIGPLVKTPAAHWTLVRRLLQMEDLVHGQCARLAETLTALQTLERFLLGVYVPADISRAHARCSLRRYILFGYTYLLVGERPIWV